MSAKVILCLIIISVSYAALAYFKDTSGLKEKHLDIVLHKDVGYFEHKLSKIERDKYLSKNNAPEEIKEISSKKLLNNNKLVKKINSFGNKIVDFSGFSNGGEGEGNIGLWLPIGNDASNDNIENSIIYISNWQNGQLISCNVNKAYYDPATSGGSNGSGVTPTGLYNCKTMNNLGLNSPENMVINNNVLYIVNFGITKSFVSSCKLDINGNIINCFNFDLPIKNATYINFNSINQILVSQFEQKSLSQITNCQADNAGNIVLCSGATTIDASLIPPLIVNSFQYKTDPLNNAIDKCMGGACQLITNQLFVGPIGVYVSQNTAYIANSNNTVIGCGVDQNSGLFFNCTTLASGLNSPSGITQLTLNNN